MNIIFREWAETVGLQINQVTSKVFLVEMCQIKKNYWLYWYEWRTLPIKYLGVLLSSDYIHISHHTLLLNKVFYKLEGWDSSLLSAVGRAELIQSTITRTVLYWLLIYPLPSSVLNKIEAMCANFFWGGKTHKIAWKNNISKATVEFIEKIVFME